MPTVVQDYPLWNSAKSHLQGLFPYDIYRTWFEPMQCLEESHEQVVLGVPNEFAAIWIQDNYEDLITRLLTEAAECPVTVSFRVQEDPSSARSESPALELEQSGRGLAAQPRLSPRQEAARAPVRGRRRGDIVLNPRNTFEHFVVGSGNQLAHAACIAVANAPAKAYNPLFLYGDTGLGKTHLMQAIAHQILVGQEESCIAYVSSESFTNQFIEALQSNTIARFRQRYRQVDVLLIDDVQFLTGKERIQEEFFHTFNELFEQQKQIVLTSDRPAGEIAKLENRLVSRFQWGMVADIQPPDFETRLAILSKKARAMNLDLPEPILDFLAEKVSRNVRRMEGALNRVAGYASLNNGKLDVSAVERLLRDILSEESSERVGVEKIMEKVSNHHKLRVEDLKSRRRPQNIVLPRQIAMYLSRIMTSHSLAEIGKHFGGRDHGTVIHAVKAIENLMEQDESIKREVHFLQEHLTGGGR